MDQRISTQETVWFLDTRVEILIASGAGSDGLSVMRHVAPYGDSPPMHVHETEDEVFHILTGRVRFRVDGIDRMARAGDMMLAPKGVAHSYRVESEDGATFVTVTARGDFEALVRDLSRPATGPGLPVPHGAPSPEEAEGLARACQARGITLVGPPLGAEG